MHIIIKENIIIKIILYSYIEREKEKFCFFYKHNNQQINLRNKKKEISKIV
jgi:hypothetical protein